MEQRHATSSLRCKKERNKKTEAILRHVLTGSKTREEMQPRKRFDVDTLLA
jgi:hypothetical protein